MVEPPLGQHILAMTAHIVFRAIDPDRPATQSPIVIEDVIRGAIGYRGLLLSDDLSMEALAGPIETRALASLEAGCDLALHCNGKLEELIAVLDAVPAVAPADFDRLQALAPARPLEVAALDDVLAELETRLGHGVVGV
jgi:beta-N-acetylhexosaminidase